MNENIFDKLDFGPFRALLDNDDITDISYDNNGQIWIRSLTQGSMRVEIEGATPEFVEKLAFVTVKIKGRLGITIMKKIIPAMANIILINSHSIQIILMMEIILE